MPDVLGADLAGDVVPALLADVQILHEPRVVRLDVLDAGLAGLVAARRAPHELGRARRLIPLVGAPLLGRVAAPACEITVLDEVLGRNRRGREDRKQGQYGERCAGPAPRRRVSHRRYHPRIEHMRSVSKAHGSAD